MHQIFKLYVPKQIADNQELSLAAKYIYGILFAASVSGKPECSANQLVKFTGKSVQNTYSILRKLVKKNLVESAKNDFKENFKIKENFKGFGKTVYNTFITNEVSNKSISKIKRRKSVSERNTNSRNDQENLFGRIQKYRSPKNKRKKYVQPLKNDRLLDLVFLLPNIPKHRPGTMIYLRSIEYLQKLHVGKLFANQNLDQKWLAQFKIPDRTIKQAWPEFILLRVFENVAKAYTLGYAPEDKKTLPKSFPDILYNPRSRKSLFLKIAVQGTKKADDTIKRTEEGKLSPLEKQMYFILLSAVKEAMSKKELLFDELQTLIKSVKLITSYLVLKKNTKSSDMQLSELGFVKDYASWIRDEEFGKLKTGCKIAPGTVTWSRFIRARGYGI